VRVSQDRNRDASSSAPIPNVTAMIAAALSASGSLRTGRTSTPPASPTGAAVATIAVVDAKGTRPRPKSRCPTPDDVVLGPSDHMLIVRPSERSLAGTPSSASSSSSERSLTRPTFANTGPAPGNKHNSTPPSRSRCNPDIQRT